MEASRGRHEWGDKKRQKSAKPELCTLFLEGIENEKGAGEDGNLRSHSHPSIVARIGPKDMRHNVVSSVGGRVGKGKKKGTHGLFLHN